MEFDERMGKCASGVRVCKAPSTRVTSERRAHKKGARSRARLHSTLGPAALTRRLLPLLFRPVADIRLEHAVFEALLFDYRLRDVVERNDTHQRAAFHNRQIT